MEIMLLIICAISILVILGSRPARPQLIIMHSVEPETVHDGSGCIMIIIALLIILMLFGTIEIR